MNRKFWLRARTCKTFSSVLISAGRRTRKIDHFLSCHFLSLNVLNFLYNKPKWPINRIGRLERLIMRNHFFKCKLYTHTSLVISHYYLRTRPMSCSTLNGASIMKSSNIKFMGSGRLTQCHSLVEGKREFWNELNTWTIFSKVQYLRQTFKFFGRGVLKSKI